MYYYYEYWSYIHSWLNKWYVQDDKYIYHDRLKAIVQIECESVLNATQNLFLGTTW